MFQLVTTSCFIFSIAVIATAQTYEDLEATYGVQDVPLGDEGAGDGDGDYGDEIVTNGDEYGGYDYDDYDTHEGVPDFVNVSFSAERLKELYTCLCLGAYTECNIHYSVEGHTWSVDSIEKHGTFYSESESCKYYRCSHVEDSFKIACTQVDQRSAACGEAGSAQFLQQKDHDCCGATCVGIFWSSAEEQLSFLQNSSEIEHCNESCLCPANGEGGTRVTKVTDSYLSNDTLIDKYIIDKITPEKISEPSQESDISGSVSSKRFSSSTPSSSKGVINDILKTESADNVTKKFGNSPSYDISDNGRNPIILAAVVAIVSAIIVVSCILVAIIIFRRRNRRSMKLNGNTNPTGTGNAAILKSEPHLSYASPIRASEAPVTQYSPAGSDNVTTTSLNEYQESPTFPGFSKNGMKVADSIDTSSVDSNRPRKNIIHSKPMPPAQATKISPTKESSFANDPKLRRGKLGENTNNDTRGYKPENYGQQYGKASDGQIGGKDRVNLSDGDSGGAIGDKRDVEKRGLVRRDPGNRALTSGKGDDDVESRQPLLTFRQIKESVV